MIQGGVVSEFRKTLAPETTTHKRVSMSTDADPVLVTGATGTVGRDIVPQLAERGPPRLLDRLQSATDLRRVVIEQSPGRSGLDHHDTDGVGDDVVQFPSDAASFLRDGAAGIPCEEVCERLRAASDDPTALQLRAMSMIYESIRNKGGLVLVPSDALRSMNLGTVLGAKAYESGGFDPAPGQTGEEGEA